MTFDYNQIPTNQRILPITEPPPPQWPAPPPDLRPPWIRRVETAQALGFLADFDLPPDPFDNSPWTTLPCCCTTCRPPITDVLRDVIQDAELTITYRRDWP